MTIRAAEVRECLRDADLVALLEPDTFETWKRMTEGLVEEWHSDLSERLLLAADDIAGRAARRWPKALDAKLARESLRNEGYASLRATASDDWRDRLVAFRAEAKPVTMESRHVLDGVLPSVVLALAITEALGGQLAEDKSLAFLEHERHEDALMIGAAYFGTRRASTQHKRQPKAKGLGQLSTALGILRWADGARAKALGPDGKLLATWAGRAALGQWTSSSQIEAESHDDGVRILIDGRKLVQIPTETLEVIASLVPRAAAARLRELVTNDDGYELLADAVAGASANRSFAALLGLPSTATPPGELRHHARLYDAIPVGPRPHAVTVSSTHGRETRATAVADAKGAHVGYVAHVPLSREFLGHPLRAVYGLDGQRRGRMQEDEGGWRFLEGEPIGGFWTAPERIELV